MYSQVKIKKNKKVKIKVSIKLLMYSQHISHLHVFKLNYIVSANEIFIYNAFHAGRIRHANGVVRL